MKTKVKYILYDRLIDRKYAEEKDHYKYKIVVAPATEVPSFETGFSSSITSQQQKHMIVSYIYTDSCVLWSIVKRVLLAKFLFFSLPLNTSFMYICIHIYTYICTLNAHDSLQLGVMSHTCLIFLSPKTETITMY